VARISLEKIKEEKKRGKEKRKGRGKGKGEQKGSYRKELGNQITGSHFWIFQQGGDLCFQGFLILLNSDYFVFEGLEPLGNSIVQEIDGFFGFIC